MESCMAGRMRKKVNGKFFRNEVQQQKKRLGGQMHEVGKNGFIELYILFLIVLEKQLCIFCILYW